MHGMGSGEAIGARTGPREGEGARLATRPSWFRGIGARLFLLLLLATIPAAGVLVVSTGQVIRAIEDEALHAARLRASETAIRHGTTLELAKQLLAATLLIPGVTASTPETCDQVLAALLATQGNRITNIWVVDPDGGLRCSGVQMAPGGNYAHLEWFVRAQRARAPVVGPVMMGVVSETLVLTVAWPILRDDRVGPTIATAVPLTYLRRTERDQGGQGMEVWLIDAAGQTFSVSDGGVHALPSAADMARLLGPDGERGGRMTGLDGVSRLYAHAHAGSEVTVVVALPTERIDSEARRAAFASAFGFALFAATGLACVGLGGSLLVARPLGELSRQVEAWRPGARFEPLLSRHAPAEVATLSASFAAATELLGQRERELRTALVRCDLLVAEVHHRVRNNLQIISSLLNLQASRLSDPTARAEFLAVRSRIRALATLYRHLETTTERDVVRLRPFLDELAVQLFDALGEPAGSRIALQVQAPDLEMTADRAVPFALVLTELLTNALKFAFPDGRQGRIDALVELVGDDVRLVVQDDGVGRTDEVPEDGKPGLGTRLVDGFARQLGATVERSYEPSGTRVELRFPLRGGHPRASLPLV